MRISMLALLILSLTSRLSASDVEVIWQSGSFGTDPDSTGVFQIPSSVIPGNQFVRAHLHNTTANPIVVTLPDSPVTVSGSGFGLLQVVPEVASVPFTLAAAGSLDSKNKPADAADVLIGVTVASGATYGQVTAIVLYGPTAATATTPLTSTVTLHVQAAASAPLSAALVGTPDPVQANTAIASTELPSVTISNPIASTSYSVTWSFNSSIALIDGSSTPANSFSESVVAPAGTSFVVRFGDGDPVAAAQKSLAFGSQGVFTVSATVSDGVTTVAATSNVGDNTIVVYDPFSSVAASGKGSLNIAVGKQQPKINFSLSYKNGAGKGNLVYNSPSENVSFSATSIGYLTATGSAGVSEGDGTLNNVGGWHYKLNVDGSTNSFKLVLTGPGTTYSVGPATLSADKKGDITVTSPPNG